MQYYKHMFRPVTIFCLIILTLAFNFSCTNKQSSNNKDEVVNPAETDQSVKQHIENIFASLKNNHFKLTDSSTVSYHRLLENYYGSSDYYPVWSSEQKWLPQANMLNTFIDNAALQGLYKEDYHFKNLQEIKVLLEKDSVKKLNPVLWANADVLMSEAFAGLLKDLKLGRLLPDSLSWKNDTVMFRTFFAENFNKLKNKESFDDILENIQPKQAAYKSLKKTIKAFIQSMDTSNYTYLLYPNKDSVGFLKSLKIRLYEAGILIKPNADSLQLNKAIKEYQKLNGLLVDGKVGTSVVKKLNLTDKQKFNTIAITLDKYKMLPESMPQKYIWVNLPSYNLNVYEEDTVVFKSKIICGKSTTPTPLITGLISDMVLYPTWTVPSSIISKDMLPGLKRNTSYLARKGLYLLNGKGEKLNPASINWAKYSKGIPYRIQQESGDGNALGVIKFNFENPYSVYLHDTNQRYLFKNSARALSHGCVRVQEWQKLANFIVRNDSLNLKKNDIMRLTTDSITNWIAHKERHTITVKNKMPLFIRYFSCESENGAIKFYDDIYGIDRDLKQKFFAGK